MKKTFAIIFALFLLYFSASQLVRSPLEVRAQDTFKLGDANGDGQVSLADFEVWRQVYTQSQPTPDPTPGSPTIAPTQQPTANKRLILHNWPGGAAMSPQYVRDNAAWFETKRDFLDGVAVIFPGSAQVMKNNVTSYDAYLNALSPVKNLPTTNIKYNFALVFNNRPADVFDDWTGAIQNWKNLARAARDTGLTGIMFDNEEYFEYWGNWPEQSTYKDKTLKQYQDQTRLRGRQVMEAVASEFPTVDFIVLHGPYISEPSSPDPTYNFVSSSNELKGPFFAGLMEGKGSTATVIDGGEMYGLRSASDFSIAYNWQRNGIASDETNSAFIPAALRPIWKRDISVSYGIYNKGDPRGGTMTPTIYQTTLTHALRQADKYVWLYTDDSSFINIGSPQMGEDWMNAARNAKNTYAQ